MPQKQKKPMKEKVKIAKRCLAGEVSISGAAAEAGVEWKAIKQWVMQYEAEGAAAFLPGRRNHAYSPELKLQAVQEYLSGKGSLSEISKKCGSYMKQGRDTTQEDRIQIVKGCLASGKNYGGMALKYKVSYQQVRAWTLRFEEMGEAGLEDRRGKRKKDQSPRTELEKAQIEIEQLKHKLYLAEMERDLLKKLDEIERRDAFRK